MDLVRAGIVIDPTEAVKGAAVVMDSASKMAKTVQQALEAVDKSSKETGAAIESGSRDMGKALDDIGKEAKEAGRAVKEAGGTMEKALEETAKTAKDTGKAVKDSGATMEKALDNTGKAAKEAGERGGAGLEKLKGIASGTGEGIRRMAIDVMDGLGLLNTGVGSLVRRGDSLINFGTRAADSLSKVSGAASSAIPDLAGTGAAATGAAGGIGALTASLGPLLLILGAVVVAVGAAVVAFKALKAGVAFTGEAIGSAAAIEKYATRLSFLSGSMEEAGETVRRLNRFAGDSPFQSLDVLTGATGLQKIRAEALLTDDALKTIGGTAVVAGKQFAEASNEIGKVYDGLRRGTGSMQDLERLGKEGLISGATIAAVAELGKEAEATGDKTARFAEQWNLVYSELSKNQDALAVAAYEWNSLLQTIADKWEQVKAEFGKPIMDALKPALVAMIQLLNAILPLAQALGQTIGNAIKTLVYGIQAGEIGMAIVSVFAAAFETAAALWIAGMITAITTITGFLTQSFVFALAAPFTVFVNLFTGGINMLAALLTGQFTEAMGTANQNFGDGGSKVIKYLAATLYNQFAGALARVVNRFHAGMMRVINSVASAINGILAKASGIPFIGGKIGGAELPTDFGSGGDLWKFEEIETGSLWDAAAGAVPNIGRQEVLNSAEKFDALNVPGGFQQAALPTAPPIALDSGAGGGGGGGGGKGIKEMTDQLKEQKGALESLIDSWSDLAGQMDQAAASFAQGFARDVSSALTDAIMGTKTWKEAFADLATSVVKGIIQMVTQMWVQYTVALMLKNVMGAIPGFGGGMFGGGIASVLHGGGNADDGAPKRSGLRLYHGGGRASSERIAMLEKNETVLTAEQGAEIRDRLRNSGGGSTRGSNGGGGQPVTILNVTDASQVIEAIAENPDAIVNAINRRLPAVRRLIQSGNRR